MKIASVVCALLLFGWSGDQQAANNEKQYEGLAATMISAQECHVYSHIKDNVFTKIEARSIAGHCPRHRQLYRRS